MSDLDKKNIELCYYKSVLIILIAMSILLSVCTIYIVSVAYGVDRTFKNFDVIIDMVTKIPTKQLYDRIRNFGEPEDSTKSDVMNIIKAGVTTMKAYKEWKTSYNEKNEEL